jgi:hypothetical protein
MLMKTTKLPRSECLNCGHPLDRATHVDGARRAKPGDVTLCIRCSHIMIFTEDMSFRNPTDEELTEIAADADVMRAAVALARMREEMPYEDDDKSDLSRWLTANRLGRPQ